jgi:hypothetical protein
VKHSLWIAALALVACKQSEPAGDPAGGTAKPSDRTAAAGAARPAAPAAITGEARSLSITGFAVDVTTPKGWSEREWSGGLMFSDPAEKYYPSTFFVTPGCQGNCATVAANVAGFLDAQQAMHTGAGRARRSPAARGRPHLPAQGQPRRRGPDPGGRDPPPGGLGPGRHLLGHPVEAGRRAGRSGGVVVRGHEDRDPVNGAHLRRAAGDAGAGRRVR